MLAHVPDLNDFVGGMKILLAPGGVITMEFPHLLRLMAENQFDTIYHEHFSYFSFLVVEQIFAHHGLTLFDVEELPTHGGSLRIYARHAEDDGAAGRRRAWRRCASSEIERGLRYARSATRLRRAGEGDQAQAPRVPDRRQATRQDGSSATARPARATRCSTTAASAPTSSTSPSTRNPLQAGQVHAGHAHPDPARRMRSARRGPDYVLILPWNLKDEIRQQAATSASGAAGSSCRSHVQVLD